MSTKIYYAWRVEGLTTLKNIHKLGRKVLAPKVKEIVYNGYRSLLSGFDLKGKEVVRKYMQDFYLNNDKEFKRYVSPKIEMIFYHSRNGTMMIPFCEGRLFDREVYSMLDNLENCVPWGYWNNTDRPEEITSKEWNQRKHDWNNIFSGDDNYASFAETGFSMTLHSSYLPIPSELWPSENYPEMWIE